MGFEEPLPDDVRRLLENESAAVMARELLRARELADSRAWLVVELAQTAGVKVTIDEVKRGARTLASVYNAAVADAAKVRAERMQAERDEARAEIERLHKIIGIQGSRIMSLAREAGITFNLDEYTRGGRPLAGLADEAAAVIQRMRKEREDLVHVNSVKVVAEDAARMAAELAEARAEVERLRAEKSRAYLLGAAVDDANRVLNEAGVAKENSAGQALTLWDRVERLVDERDNARARAGWNSLGATGAKATGPSAPQPMIGVSAMCMSKDAAERAVVNINVAPLHGAGAMDPVAFAAFVREHGLGPYRIVPMHDLQRAEEIKRLLAELDRALAPLTKVP